MIRKKQGLCGTLNAMQRVFRIVQNASLALAAAAGSSGVAHASTFDFHLSGYVPQRCTGALTLSSDMGAVKFGAIETNCNTAFSVEMMYPAELGPINVVYADRSVRGHDGQVLLSARSEPSIGQTPVRIELLSPQAQNEPAAFSVVLSAQGL
ncbi:MAG TPA: hypothetical protein VHC73_15630 [Vitreimonas sp.]|nr:hypothetical protein [Vitreimonas sp.]